LRLVGCWAVATACQLAAATAPDEKGGAAAAKMKAAIDPMIWRVRVASWNELAMVLLDESGWKNQMNG
jgi:hypothetical protein